MKKITFRLMIIVLSLTAFPNNVLASNEPTLAPSNTTEVPAEVQAMYDRLEEIKEMDKSEMSSAEKKELRKEVKSIKSELRSTGNGVYLSVGAIIIIILLLILLL
ncbi:MAG: hypothetical protein QM710_01485 [Flavobacterium sp.]